MFEDDVSRYSDCYFYDVDLRELSASFDSIYKVFKRIRKRAERRQTVQISKTIFDYYDRKADLARVPQKYYDFRNGTDRICLYAYRGFYSVLCVGFMYPKLYKREDIYLGVGFPYGKTKSLDEIKKLFYEILWWYFENVIYPENELF